MASLRWYWVTASFDGGDDTHFEVAARSTKGAWKAAAEAACDEAAKEQRLLVGLDVAMRYDRRDET